jgi:hypothetical protein
MERKKKILYTEVYYGSNYCASRGSASAAAAICSKDLFVSFCSVHFPMEWIQQTTMTKQKMHLHKWKNN